jgi:PAS domain S-box-containing protein
MLSRLQHGAVTGVPAERGWVADALAAARVCAWSWNEELGRLAWEGTPTELLGERPETLAELEERIHEDDRAPRRAALDRALDRGERWACTFRVEQGGELRWLEERGRSFAGPPGRSRAVAVLVDVSPQREAAEALELRLRREARGRHEAQLATGTAEAAMRALARSEAFLESIFTSMADGVVLFATDGRITRMNPTAAQMLGFGDEEARMTSAERMSRVRLLDVDGKAVPFERLPVVLALRGEPVRGQTYCLDLPDGRKVWTVCGAAPIRAPDGAVAGAVLTLGDVTRLREVHEQREDLSRMISHDLRTPLGVILAQAKLIGRRSEGPEAVRSRADAIVTSAQRMTAMLNDLVESALLEAGKLHLEREPVDLATMSRDLRGRLAAPYDGERIRIEVAAGVPRVSADPARLERVLVNLFTNALKYSEAGTEVVVRIGGDASGAVLEVEDRGPGIKPEDLPHLFERYFRALGHRRYEGMGLGLYTARCLVEAHGGTIAVASEPGRGSTFRVRLPTAAPGA